jgi:hypothetical protein
VLQDLPPGLKVKDQEECEEMCSAAEGCNAASFYYDAEAFGGSNCWLKAIAHSCDLPADADTDPNAVLLLKVENPCAPLLLEISLMFCAI